MFKPMFWVPLFLIVNMGLITGIDYVNKKAYENKEAILLAEIAQRDSIICDLLPLKLLPERHITPKRVKPDCPPCIYKEK